MNKQFQCSTSHCHFPSFLSSFQVPREPEGARHPRDGRHREDHAQAGRREEGGDGEENDEEKRRVLKEF